ncbi:MAG TPA: hypothetical protein VLA88_02780 [Candidatus Saccharimonadales bacterium]|nr:hypothetical protein [Candidatus Saccharimonadales bacterium]
MLGGSKQKLGRAAVQHAGRERNRTSRRESRSFPSNNGTVNGQPAYVQQTADRTTAYFGEGQEGKVVTNDGITASYVRDEDGHVPYDDAMSDPSAGYNAFDDPYYRGR